MLVSSANRRVDVCSKQSDKSLMKLKKKSRPKFDSRGTPYFKYLNADDAPLTLSKKLCKLFKSALGIKVFSKYL